MRAVIRNNRGEEAFPSNLYIYGPRCVLPLTGTLPLTSVLPIVSPYIT
jgi:hypothetical protein